MKHFLQIILTFFAVMIAFTTPLLAQDMYCKAIWEVVEPNMNCATCRPITVTVTNNPTLITGIEYNASISEGEWVEPHFQSDLDQIVTVCNQSPLHLYAHEPGGYWTYVDLDNDPFTFNGAYVPVHRYKYQWSTGNPADTLPNLVVAGDFNGTTQSGSYTVTVTDPATGCSQVDTFTVKVPKMTPIICNLDGNGDAAVNVEVTDGQAPYVYSYRIPPFNFIPQPQMTGPLETFSGLSPGASYILRVSTIISFLIFIPLADSWY